VSPEREQVDVDGRYVTEAVESVVRDRDRQVIGHVGLFDCDGVDEGAAVDAAEQLPGPVAVLLSSSRAFHLWALAVDDLGAWLSRGEGLDVVEREHLALAPGRDCSVLRVDRKVALADGRTVKPAPVPRRVVDGRTDLPVSQPHVDVLDDLGADVLDVVDDQELVGHGTRRRAHLADIGGRSE
jgi:hypothetical protein